MISAVRGLAGIVWMYLLLLAAVCAPWAGATEPDMEIFTLNDCIEIALANQPAIETRRYAHGAAVQRQAEARSYYRPQLGLSARYTHLDEPRSVNIPDPFGGQVGDIFSDAGAFFGIARQAGSAAANLALDNPGQPPFSVAKQAVLSGLPDTLNVGLLGQDSLITELRAIQPLWTGGKIRYRHQQAHLGVHAARADVAKSEQQTVFDVTRAYLGVLLARELITVAEDAAGHLRAIERVVEALLDEGDEHITAVDLYRARTMRLLAQSETAGGERAAALAHEALRWAMGLDRFATFDVADRQLVPFERQIDLSTILDEAVLQRPELEKARIAVQIGELERRLAVAEYHPQIGLFGQLATIADNGGFANPNDRQEWAVGLTVDVPLYTGGRRGAQTRQARFQKAQASEFRRLAEQLITLEVQKVFLEYVELSQRAKLDMSALADAERTVRGYWNQYVGGLIRDEDLTQLFEDLVNAEALHAIIRAKYNNVVYGHNLSLARIRLVTASDEYSHFFQRVPADSAPVDDA